MRDQKVQDARAVAGVTSTRSNVAGTGIEPMPRPQTNRSAISAAMEKGRIADSSEETATSDKAHRSVVLRPTRSTKAAAAMFPTSMPRAVTDMKAALRPALEADRKSTRLNSRH